MIKQVGRNVIFNVLGFIVPVFVGIFTVPVLLGNLGEARLGIFTLAMGLVGFAGICDLGLGRALTQSVASAAGKRKSLQAIAVHVRRTLPVILLMAVAWGCVLWLCAEPIAHGVFKLDGQLAEEARLGIRWLAIAIPAILLSTSLTGVLEGLQRFALVNLLRVPLGVATFVVPAIASFRWPDIGQVIGVLALVRLAGLGVWFIALVRELPLLTPLPHDADRLDGRDMWRFTGWLTVSNMVGPLMVHADRFYLAAIFPPATVAYYTVPLDTLFRGTALPLAAMNAIFPALAHAGPFSPDAARVVRGAAWLMLVFWAIPLCIAGLALEWLLSVWLGVDFATKTLLIAQWLLLGVMINGFAHIPYALLQSAGRADLTARLHVLELPVYAVLILMLVDRFGIAGAAMAWTARVVLDIAALYLQANKRFPGLRRPLSTAARFSVGTSVILCIINFA